MTAYNETCASVGMDFWNHRLFLLHGDAKYIDVMERTLYNGLISGVVARRQDVLLSEPARVERPARAQRVVRRRLLPRQHHALHAVGARLPLRDRRRRRLREPLRRRAPATSTLARRRKVKVVAGDALSVGRRGEDDRDARAGAHVRGQRPHPGLGAQRAGAERSLSLRRHGARRRPRSRSTAQPVPMTLDKGYVTIDRAVEGRRRHRARICRCRSAASSRTRRSMADRDRVALQRGPIVYAAEWPDNPNGKVRNIVLPDASALTTEFRADLLNGVQVIKGRAVGLARDATGACHRDRAAVHGDPLCDVGQPRPRADGRLAGAHRRRPRGRRRSRRSRRPARSRRRRCRAGAARTCATSSTARSRRTRPTTRPRTSTGGRRSGSAARVGRDDVREAGDGLAKPRSTGSTTPAAAACACRRRGGCSTRTATGWKPVEAVEGYGVARDRLEHACRSSRSRRGALRIEVTMQPTFSAGLQEWKVK